MLSQLSRDYFVTRLKIAFSCNSPDDAELFTDSALLHRSEIENPSERLEAD